MRTFALLVRFFFAPLCVGFLLALVIAAGVQWHAQSQDDVGQARSAADLLTGIRTGNRHTTYLTVTSYDAASRSMLALVHSAAIHQSVPQLLKLSEDFSMERRDAIIQNGAIVGTKPIVKANENELQPDTRGFGMFHLAEDGSMVIDYLLIGDPFPRP